MAPDHEQMHALTFSLSPFRRRRLLQCAVAGALALTANGITFPVLADQSAPTRGQSVDPAPSRESASAPPTTTSEPFYPHYPSFAITPDGIVVRSLSRTPPAKVQAAVQLAPQPATLQAPYHSQFDGSIYAETNCGPTALSMALGALGVTADQLTLRALANQQMGTTDPNNGTSWASLAYAAQQSGVSTKGLTNSSGKAYRRWTLDALQGELTQGHPVMLLIRYWDLPDHYGSSFAGDHYIVALGFDQGGNLVYNDPASRNGADLKVSPSQIVKAWSDVASGLNFTAMALYR